ncbi:MAG: hypothetical protein JSV04_08435 [Candidatus Heimdallarchaeota archaeon]|nr:MAG: hypothetical protein JSV04_08435 [Candidatus Heimdallarchaeota archaeon]
MAQLISWIFSAVLKLQFAEAFIRGTIILIINKCKHSLYSRPTIKEAYLVLEAVFHIFEWYDTNYGTIINWEENFVQNYPFKVNGLPIQPSKRITFYSQLDSEKHPKTDSAYQCDRCSRFICSNCYENIQTLELSECPFCQGTLIKTQ